MTIIKQINSLDSIFTAESTANRDGFEYIDAQNISKSIIIIDSLSVLETPKLPKFDRHANAKIFEIRKLIAKIRNKGHERSKFYGYPLIWE